MTESNHEIRIALLEQTVGSILQELTTEMRELRIEMKEMRAEIAGSYVRKDLQEHANRIFSDGIQAVRVEMDKATKESVGRVDGLALRVAGHVTAVQVDLDKKVTEKDFQAFRGNVIWTVRTLVAAMVAVVGEAIYALIRHA